MLIFPTFPVFPYCSLYFIFSSLCDRFSIVVNLPNLMSLFSNSQVRNCIAGFGLNTQLLPPTSPTSHSIWLFIMKTDFHFSSPLNGFNCVSFYWGSQLTTTGDVFFKMKPKMMVEYCTDWSIVVLLRIFFHKSWGESLFLFLIFFGYQY